MKLFLFIAPLFLSNYAWGWSESGYSYYEGEKMIYLIAFIAGFVMYSILWRVID